MTMTIKSKLTTLIVAVIVSISVIITLVSTFQSASAIEHAEFNKLSSVEVAKHGEINSYFCKFHNYSSTHFTFYLPLFKGLVK